MRFFKLIISRGLWSVSTYRYVWNFSQPYMMAKSVSLDVGVVGLGVHEGFAS